MNHRPLLNLSIIVFALAGLGGCSQTLPAKPSATAELSDIHERLSYAIRGAGYEHGIMSRRENDSDIDSIFISVPLDGVTRQHPSLEKMLQSIGSICALPEYAGIPVSIELDSSNQTNFQFMRDVLEKALAGKPNARIVAIQNPRNAITITVIHSPFKKSR